MIKDKVLRLIVDGFINDIGRARICSYTELRMKLFAVFDDMDEEQLENCRMECMAKINLSSKKAPVATASLIASFLNSWIAVILAVLGIVYEIKFLIFPLALVLVIECTCLISYGINKTNLQTYAYYNFKLTCLKEYKTTTHTQKIKVSPRLLSKKCRIEMVRCRMKTT